ALKVMAKERQLDLLTIELSCLRVKVDVAQLVAVLAPPIAVRPGTDDQQIVDARIQTFGPAISLQSAEEILGVVPAAHRHHGAANIFEMRPNVARLPERVIGRMLKE